MVSRPRKHLLVVSGVWPHVEGAVEAANVVVYSILSEIAALEEFDVSYGYVNSDPAEIPPEAVAQISRLRENGVCFIKPLLIPRPPPYRKRPMALLKAFFFKPEAIFFGYGSGNALKERCEREIDAVLTIWSEVGLNAACDVGVFRFAYHGNPDHKVFHAFHEAKQLMNVSSRGLKSYVEWAARTILGSIIERGHLAILRRYNLVADVAQNDANYYVNRLINACYLPNMWPMSPPPGWEALRDTLEAENPYKIVGNVGNLSATGNTLGLLTLGKEVLPVLERILPGGNFRVHIFGKGQPRSYLAALLSHPAILKRGFVEDLNTEILSAPVFLICNNRQKFKVGNTRFLHAWSLGACVVAFQDCREAMPEIKHGYNTLLGSNPEEVASLVVRALQDRDLRRHIGRGGIETLRQHFYPPTITRKLVEYMRASGF